MMKKDLFGEFFKDQALSCLLSVIRSALNEDGTDLTSNAVFSPADCLRAKIIAKEDSIVAGSAFFPFILQETSLLEPGDYKATYLIKDGDKVKNGTVIAEFSGSARILLRSERILLNFLTHLSGIANLVSKYVSKLEGTGVRLLDTRKTLPGLRYPEKYAVLLGGGTNHRKNLSELLMLKDNHLDAAGGVTAAVNLLREKSAGIGIEVECRNFAELKEAALLKVDRIMLDNMSADQIRQALDMVPKDIEIEVSGNVDLDKIADLARIRSKRGIDFISVGRLTHSAPIADFSMLIF